MKIHRTLMILIILLLIYLIPIYGLGSSPRDSEMLKHLRKEAEQGNASLQFSLGLKYLQGNGVSQDLTEAAKWFRKAAEQGNSSAQFTLGMAYLQGSGVSQDYDEAAIWFRKAAEKGNALAQCMLGALYIEGWGVPKDNIQAYMWVTLSIVESTERQNPFFQKAKDMSDSLVQKITPEQIEKAQEFVREWKALRTITPEMISEKALESKLIKKVKPEYPELARMARVEGDVVLVVTVNEEGNVNDIAVFSGHPLLNGAAVNAVRQWKYSPTLQNGKPISVKATVTLGIH